MKFVSKRREMLCLTAAVLMVPAWGGAYAQQQELPAQQQQSTQQSGQQEASSNGVLTTVNGKRSWTKGPEIHGVIVARKGDMIRVRASDGTATNIAFDSSTDIKGTGGFLGLGHKQLGQRALLPGLPVEVDTMQSGNMYKASEIKFKNKDLNTARMIRNGTAQQFAEQGAAIGQNGQNITQNSTEISKQKAETEALKGRFGDIDNYDIKGITNVYFRVGKANLSQEAKQDLCNAADKANSMNNALLLVVGYTDSTGSQELNQKLSEKRAAHVVNYLQQACHWKPYRMLTPTGMAEADPLASNSTKAGRAKNRRVSVNILVSKAIEASQNGQSSQGNGMSSSQQGNMQSQGGMSNQQGGM